nr:transmembrane protein [Jeilongvirus sp.]
MSSDYEDPASIPSCYGSMSSSRTTYKSSQLRRSPPALAPKHVRLSRSSNIRNRSYNIYFAFVIFVCSINMALLCYITIAIESKCQQAEKPSIRPLPKAEASNCPETDQIVSSINTMMNALTYTLPQVLTANKHSLITRMNHLVLEIKDLVKMNNLDLNVKLGINRTIALRTGNNGKQETAVSSVPQRPTKPPVVPSITLIPAKPTNKVMFYPLVKNHVANLDDSYFDNIKRLNLHHNPEKGELQDDIANLNPTF